MSYYFLVMGLWGLAEMAAGIIVSCLPITPKFFQYLGPKGYGVVSNVLSSRSKLRLMAGSKSSSQHKDNQTNSVERVLDKTQGKEVYINQAHRKGEYMTLTELDDAPTKSNTTTDWLPTSNEGVLTKRDDLESGF